MVVFLFIALFGAQRKSSSVNRWSQKRNVLLIDNRLHATGEELSSLSLTINLSLSVKDVAL